MLLFQIDGAPWAIPAASIRDLVSLVNLQKMSGDTSSTLAGLLNYHQEILPVVDVSQVVSSQPAPSALSTRIAIVDVPEQQTEGDRFHRLGLILDRAFQTAQLTEEVTLPMTHPYSDTAFRNVHDNIGRETLIADNRQQIPDSQSTAEHSIIQQLAIAPLIDHITRRSQPPERLPSGTAS